MMTNVQYERDSLLKKGSLVPSKGRDIKIVGGSHCFREDDKLVDEKEFNTLLLLTAGVGLNFPFNELFLEDARNGLTLLRIVNLR